MPLVCLSLIGGVLLIRLCWEITKAYLINNELSIFIMGISLTISDYFLKVDFSYL